jgi:hypothetical protein
MLKLMGKKNAKVEDIDALMINPTTTFCNKLESFLINKLITLPNG